MGNTMYTSDSGSHSDYGGSTQWQNTIDLLRLMQSDYLGARKQMEKVSQTLAEREALVSQHLGYAFMASRGYGTLCLVTCGAGTAGSQMGKVILGDALRPAPIPRLRRLEVRCFGRFEIRSASKQIERWQSVKAKSVLQYLMIRPREPVVKDVIMEALWPDCTPQAASDSLKEAVHGLRRTLSRLFEAKETFPYVLFVQGSYLPNPEIELWTDVEEFEQHWVLGRRLEKEGKLAEAIREFEAAEALYRGDYLEDQPYEEWTLLRREALKDTYLIMLSKLADHAMHAADYESCIMYCQKILGKDPCREDAYRRLMRCHSRLGQRSRALRWYQICQRAIQAELDATPDHETIALYGRLLKDQLI